MSMYFIMLSVVGLGLLIVIFIFLNEQRLGKEKSKKLASQEVINQKLKDKNIEDKARIEELLISNKQLKKAFEEKTNELLKAQGVASHKIADIIDQTKLRDIMTSDVISVHLEDPFTEVPRKMKEHHIRHLPIVDDSKKLVGIITQRMLYQIKSPRKLMDGEWYYDEEMLNDVILKHVMEKDVFSLLPDQSMGKALMKMTYSKCGSIPIVDETGKLVGIVTRKDIFKVIAHIYEKKWA